MTGADIASVVLAVTGLATTLGNIYLFKQSNGTIDRVTEALTKNLANVQTTTRMLNARFEQMIGVLDRHLPSP